MPKKKNSRLAALLSFILPGAGQAYNRQYVKAVVFIILSLLIISWLVYLQYVNWAFYEKLRQLGIIEDIGVIVVINENLT